MGLGVCSSSVAVRADSEEASNEFPFRITRRWGSRQSWDAANTILFREEASKETASLRCMVRGEFIHDTSDLKRWDTTNLPGIVR